MQQTHSSIRNLITKKEKCSGSSSTNVASQPWSTVYSNTRGISPTVYAGGYGAGYGGTSGYGTAIPTAVSKYKSFNMTIHMI